MMKVAFDAFPQMLGILLAEQENENVVEWYYKGRGNKRFLLFLIVVARRAGAFHKAATMAKLGFVSMAHLRKSNTFQRKRIQWTTLTRDTLVPRICPIRLSLTSVVPYKLVLIEETMPYIYTLLPESKEKLLQLNSESSFVQVMVITRISKLLRNS